MTPDRSTFAHAGAGILAAVAGMSCAHLVAALTVPASSPVLAIGSTVIDLTPTPVKEFAVREFGTADKPILIGSVLLGTVVLAGAIGVVSRRRPRLGVVLLLGLVGLAGSAALLRPDARPTDALASLVAAAVGALVLGGAVRALSPGRRPGPGDEVALGGAAAPSRRGVVLGSGALLALSALAGAGGQWVVRARTRLADIVLPRVPDSLPPLPAGLEQQHEGISAFRTPNRSFYRVDTKLVVPIVDHTSWSLTIDGDVEREVRFGYDDLRDLADIEKDITLTCVSNEVGGKLVGAARWSGVSLKRLLAEAGIGSAADQILSTDVEGFTISTPLEVALDGRDSLVALTMNGAVLPRAHGFPARLVVPGLYGFVGATKWLERLTLTTYRDREAYWTKRGWATDAPIKVSSRIDTPRPLSTIDAGQRVIGGVAWAQERGISRVDVRIDGGPWRAARLGPDAGVDYWRQWYLPWDATRGQHQLAVRAVDGDGNTQTPVRATPFPEGSSGIQEVVVTVS